MKLKIDYHPESDTLWLGNGLPTSSGEDLAENVTVFFDDAEQPNGLMIEHAAELLLPILKAVAQSPDKAIGPAAQPGKVS